MGEIVGAGLISHVPTIMFDEATRKELNDGKEISLVPGLRRLRSEVFDRLDIDTIVIIDSHWFSTVEHLLTAQERKQGIFTSSELPRGMAQMAYDYRATPSLRTWPQPSVVNWALLPMLPMILIFRSTTPPSTWCTISGKTRRWFRFRWSRPASPTIS